MLQQWHERGIFTWPATSSASRPTRKESILRDIEIIKRELPVDILEFFFLTPLPGSEDHQRCSGAGEWMDPDLNKYDLHHRVTHHPKMSDAEWEETYHGRLARLLHARAYRDGGAPPWLGRRAATGRAGLLHDEFRIMFEAEGVHPLEGGVVRLKYRRDRRYGMPIEPIGVFHWKLAVETVRKLRIYGRLAWQCWRIGRGSRTIPSATSTWTSP